MGGAVSAAVETVKETVKNPVKAATSVATGGLSSVYEFGKQAQKQKSKKEMRAMEAQAEQDAMAKRADLEQQNKGLEKQLDLATREQKKKGIASLVGDSGNTTLG